MHRYNWNTVTDLAKKNEMCPFELQLDLSFLSDVIICDYNYFFDPFVKLERYFSEEADPSNYVILIDEAHNLPSRARDMFSESISSKDIKDAKNSLKGLPFKKLKNSLSKLLKSLESLKSKEKFVKYEKMDETIAKNLSKFKELTSTKEEEEVSFPNEVRDLSRKTYRFLSLMDNYTQNAFLYSLENDKGEIELHFQSLDPSPYLKEDILRTKGVAIFSATFSPIDYYMESIVGNKNQAYLALSLIHI